MSQRTTHDGAVARAVDLLTEFCALSSASGDGEGLRAAQNWLARQTGARGMTSHVEDQPGADGTRLPQLVADCGPANRAVRLLLVGHVDTVLAAVPPVRVPGGLRATGALDMKGGLVTLLAALDLLAAEGCKPAPFRLVVVPDEETTGVVSARAMVQHGAAAKRLLVLEPGRALSPDGRGEGVRETVVLGRRGQFHWEARLSGRPAHAGIDFWQGRSALVAAADLARRATALSGPGPGPTVNVARLVAGDAEFVDALDRTHGWLGGEVRVNVVPDRARIDAEARFLTVGDGAAIANALTALAADVADKHEVEVALSTRDGLPPVTPTGASRRLVDLAVGCAARRGFALVSEADRGGVSFANLLPDPAAVAVLDGMGPVGSGMHTREETLDLESLARRIRLLADLLLALAASASE